MKIKLLTLLLSITLFACNKNDDSGDSLPAATQTGANTVGCLVNGEVFLPHAEGLSPSVNCFYQFVDGEFFFSMNFADLRGIDNERVVVQTFKTTLVVNETYILNQNIIENNNSTGGGGVYSLSVSNRYFTNAIKTGELTINRIDLSNSIISGTFWFDAINGNGETVEIREGRFDWNY